MTERLVLGMMSGTSMDGIDLCLARLSLSADEFEFHIEDTATVPFSDELHDKIRAGLSGSPDAVGELQFLMGQAYAHAAVNFLHGRKVDLAGMHGQTIAHKDGAYTLQVGTPAYLAGSLQIPVISNFREADIAAGGNGAPLMPYLDWLMARKRRVGLITLNLGGVANLSAVPPDARQKEVMGFDTGPGMGLLDEAAQRLFDKPMDLDAEISRLGQVDEKLLAELMNHAFVKRVPPKSTSRDEFGKAMMDHLINESNLSPHDIMRTLVRFTAKSVAFNINQFIKFKLSKDTIIASGGGVHHPLVMKDLAAELPGWDLADSHALGVDPDVKEALLMAVLAVANMEAISANMPGVTGARSQVLLGQKYSIQE